jgi:hypothetical protein
MWLMALLALAASPMKVVAPTFNSAGVEQDKVRYFTSYFAQKLRAQGVEVITAEEIGTLLGVERQKQLLGCMDTGSSCLAELANALGTNATARGSVALIGGEYRVDVTVLSNSARVLVEYSSRGTNERGVLDALEEAATKIADGLMPRPAAGVTSSPRRLQVKSVVPFVLGLAVAGAGGVLLGEAVSAYGRLTSGVTLNPGEGQQLASNGSTFYAAGWVGVGLGAASMVLGLVLFLLDADGAPASAPVAAQVSW